MLLKPERIQGLQYMGEKWEAYKDKYNPKREPTDAQKRRLIEFAKLINQADANLKEDWKWNTPVWTAKGNVLALGAFKDHLKINFFKGASLDDPRGLFNAGLDAKASRSIDLYENDTVDEQALKELIRAAAK